MRWALAGFVVGAVLVALWLSWEVSGGRPLGGLDEQALAATDAGGELEASATIASASEARISQAVETEGKASTALDPLLRVRSEAGLPFAFVEIEAGDAAWRGIPLEDGACDLAGFARPLGLRAPGHLPARVAAGDREIVLVPDALFTVEAPGLRECADSIRPFPPWLGLQASDLQVAEIANRLARISTWDFVSDDRWAIAVSARGLAGVLPHAVVDLAYVRADRQRTWVSFEARPGARATWNPTCEGQVAVADLDVHVVRPEGAERGELELHVWLVRPGSQESVTDAFPGGRAVRVSDVFLDARLGADEDRTTIERLPLGKRTSLTVRDALSCAYGRVVFDHDGSPREVRLLEGLEITGRLVAADAPLPGHARFAWTHQGPGEDEWAWYAEIPSLDLAQDGHFRLRSPTRVPADERVLLDLPRTLDLRVVAAGFEEFHGRFDTGGGSRLDCGDIVLASRRPAVVLAPGHGLGDRAADWQNLRLASRPLVSWRLRESRSMPDGSLALFLISANKDPEGRGLSKADDQGSGKAEELVFSDNPDDSLVVHALGPDGDAGHAFLRRPDGRYELVPQLGTTLDVDVRGLPSSGRWTIGWEWRGLFDFCAGIGPESLGEHAQFTLSAPAEGAQLWWSSGYLPPSLDASRPGESGSVPFRAPPWKIELP